MPRSVDTNYSILPDGSVLFTEVDLSEGRLFGTDPPQQSRVNWFDPIDSLIKGWIGQNSDPNGDSHVMTVGVDGDASGALDAGFQFSHSPTLGASATVKAGGNSKLLLDHLNQSEFVRHIFLNQDGLIQSGVATITWNGTAVSNNLVVGHSLGVTPRGIALNMNDVGQVACVFQGGPATSTTFQITARAAGAIGAGATTQVFWIIVGP